MNIVFVGAGKLAWHLAKALSDKGHNISAIYSRKIENATALAQRVGAVAFNYIPALPQAADLYIIAVSDTAIIEVAKKMGDCSLDRVVHTSGATPVAVLESYFKTCGSFYPLMSFSKEKSLDFQHLPICIYSKEPSFAEELLALAEDLSG
ncbi:MAG: NAD(P)-binding domain-containing protein, partial [Bacteroidota bacterium]